MKRYPKTLQVDKRGQIVIPKDIRTDLDIEEGTGFWAYTITNEGILLKKIDSPELSKHKEILSELKNKSKKVGIKTKNIETAEKKYKKTKKGKFDLI